MRELDATRHFSQSICAFWAQASHSAVAGAAPDWQVALCLPQTVGAAVEHSYTQQLEGTALTAITDEEDRVLVHNTYENGRIASQEFPEEKIYEMSTPTAGHKTANMRKAPFLRLPDGPGRG